MLYTLRAGLLVALLGMTVAAAPAFAHARLDSAVPASGSTVATAPASLRLRFTEAVVPHFCAVQVLDAHGRAVKVGSPKGEGGRTLIVALPKLGPGSYTVVWHAVAEDTHKTEGRFGFTVAP